VVMSTVGYPEPGSMEPFDTYNKVPKYCTKCRKSLKSFDPAEEYDTYTGNPIHRGTLICPTLSSLHDRWVQEKYGVWVNYRQE
jgi:hypothetical protein